MRLSSSISAAVVALLLGAGLRSAAQESAAPAPALEPVPAASDPALTNLVDLLTDGPDTEPSMDSSPTNAQDASSSNSPSGDSYRRPSGRDSRSQRSRSRSSRSNNSSRDGYSGTSFGGTNAGPNSLEWAAFQPIVTGNIFDPNRRPRTTDYAAPVARRDRDYFTLVGTMSYQDGTFAFFDGRVSEYQRSMKRSDIIAGYKVAAIDEDSVRLTRDTNQVELHVGMQMRQDDDGSWYTTSGSLPQSTLNASSLDAGTISAPTSTGSGTMTPPGGPQSDVLKKMMERREKE